MKVGRIMLISVIHRNYYSVKHRYGGHVHSTVDLLNIYVLNIFDLVSRSGGSGTLLRAACLHTLCTYGGVHFFLGCTA